MAWEGRLQRQSAILITSCQRYMPPTWLIVDVDLDHLVEVEFVRFLHCKLTRFFLPFHTSLSGRKPQCDASRNVLHLLDDREST